ncbi:TPR-like protein, partial [Athelia psychrophila]
SGKSAIAHTVAQTLHKNRILTSSFFLDTAVDSRNTLRSIFSTVARDIAARYPAFAEDISAVLEEDLSLASAPLARQFEELIKKPLCRHAHVITNPIVVVIDALDDTIEDASDTELLRILRDEVSKLPPQLRILVTSRPTRELVDFLSERGHVRSHIIDITSPENADDIGAFISGKLQDGAMRDKLGLTPTDSVTLSVLKLSAEGLFIWIVTVFRYLDNVENPEGKLRSLLSKAGRLNPTKQIDALYAAILGISGDWEDPEFCEHYKLFIGTIVAAKEPLSLAALRALHSDTQNISYDDLAHRFGPLLVGLFGANEHVRPLHLSFREFITNHANNAGDTRKFYISEKVHSQRLAVLCVQTMVRECKTAPINGTGYLARGEDDPPGIPDVFGVSEQLLYSCKSWIDHLVDLEDPDSAITEGLQSLLSEYGTMWMEIVSSKSTFRGSQVAWDWLEALAADLPAAFNAPLADSLNNMVVWLAAAGRHEEAVTAIMEAVDLRRTLAADQPAVFNAPLADSLNNMAACLAAAGRHEEAATAIMEAVDLCRTLAADQPAAFNAPLAVCLNNMAIWLAAAGRHEEAAVTAVREAVDLRRALAADQPTVFNAPLAESLFNMSNSFAAVKRHEEAVTAVREAIDLRRTLAEDQPAVFNGPFADYLNNLSIWLAAVGRHEEAVTAVREAVDLRRALAADQPTVFNGPLAESLFNMSNSLAAVKRHEEAITTVREAVDLRRTLAADQPAVFNSPLTSSLLNMSVWLAAAGRHEEAVTAGREVVDLRRTLAADQPAVFNGPLATSLVNMSNSLAAVGRHKEAFTVVREAVDLGRTLAADQPAVFNGPLADSLFNMSIQLAAVGRHEEAVTAGREVVDLHRTLAADQPAAFNGPLADALSNMSVWLAAVGRHEEALTTAREAIDLRRTLAADQPAVFNGPLANSLFNMSVWLAAVGRHEEAVTARREEADIRSALAAEHPGI